MLNEDYIIEINNDENIIIVDLAKKIVACPSTETETFCLQSKECSENIPQRIKKKLEWFAKKGSTTGFLLIKNMKLEKELIPKTPENNNSKIGEKTILARIQSMFINVISEMISYEAEGYGRLFQDVIPVRSMSHNQTSIGSSVELEIHTEQAFSNLRPDILSLSCIRGDPLATTYILPVQYIINNMTVEERNILRLPLWKTRVDLSFKLNGNNFLQGDVRGPFSIINGNDNDPFLIFDQDLMFGIDELSNSLIKKIVDIYYKYRIHHNLQSGEIILIDNNRAVHGRSPFTPKYDGNDRFIIRCFGVYDYEKSKTSRFNSSRMVSAIYS
jgi:L-asparagine oxygenase